MPPSPTLCYLQSPVLLQVLAQSMVVLKPRSMSADFLELNESTADMELV
jgi:hypothetical protein